ncbi:MAG: phosphoribosylanthranilate isomerase [Acidobacteria bacterium]|nr:phosphoribosylanthranilate isomerase [Acidobacteriota bacterium]
MFIKICGICNPQDAKAAVQAEADLLGFIFVEGTPRALDIRGAQWIRDLRGAATVGVFRDSTLERILEIQDSLKLDWVQLHGSEPDAWLDALGPQVIRRVPVPNTGVDRSRVEALLRRGVLPLIDPGAGDGATCDWQALAQRLDGLGFGLAGGLTPETVADAIRIARPTMIDVSSGVERTPGLKDHSKIRAFVQAATAAAATIGSSTPSKDFR